MQKRIKKTKQKKQNFPNTTMLLTNIYNESHNTTYNTGTRMLYRLRFFVTLILLHVNAMCFRKFCKDVIYLFIYLFIYSFIHLCIYLNKVTRPIRKTCCINIKAIRQKQTDSQTVRHTTHIKLPCSIKTRNT